MPSFVDLAKSSYRRGEWLTTNGVIATEPLAEVAAARHARCIILYLPALRFNAAFNNAASIFGSLLRTITFGV